MREKVGELLGDALDMCGASDDRCPGGGGEGKETIPCRLDERTALQGQVKQELRVLLSREGPQAGTRATSRDDDPKAWNLADAEGELGKRVVTEGGGDVDARGDSKGWDRVGREEG